MLNFAGSGHQVLRGTSASERGELRTKESGKKSIHFNGSTQNIELLLQMVIPINQFRICGAVADMIQVNWIKWRLLHNLMLQKCKPMKSDRETCCKNTSNDLKNCKKTRSYPDYALKQGRDWSKLDNSSLLFCHLDEKEINLCADNIRSLEIKRELVS